MIIMLLKCKLLISLNCSTSHIINHNNFCRHHKSFGLFPTLCLLFLKEYIYIFPIIVRSKDVLVSYVMVWLKMWLPVTSFIPNLLVCPCCGGCEWAGDCKAVIGKCITDLLRWSKCASIFSVFSAVTGSKL